MQFKLGDGPLLPHQFLAGMIENLLSHLRFLRAGLRAPSVRIERNVLIKGRLSNLTLGKRVVIQSGCVLHAGGMAWCHHQGSLSIGDDGVLSPNCVLYGPGPGGIRIGQRFDCGPGVGIFASRTDYRKQDGHIFAEVVIGNDVIVYANAVIGPGVKVGDRAVIAAGSVVLEDVPSGALVGGVPARVLKTDVR